jgi:hypothetical protein
MPLFSKQIAAPTYTKPQPMPGRPHAKCGHDHVDLGLQRHTDSTVVLEWSGLPGPAQRTERRDQGHYGSEQVHDSSGSGIG